MEKDKKEELKEMGQDIFAAIVGGTFGTLGGPAGILAGAATPVVIKKLSEIVCDLRKRQLSAMEVKKVNILLDIAEKKIQEKLNTGLDIRNDGFFQEDIERDSAREVFEGVVFASQRESEEKKIPYYANLFANIAFTEEISVSEANFLVKVAYEITYEQMEIMQLIASFQIGKNFFGFLNGMKKGAYGSVKGYRNINILTETFDLLRRGILYSKLIPLDVAGIDPSSLYLAGVGVKLYELMEMISLPFTSDSIDKLSFFLED